MTRTLPLRVSPAAGEALDSWLEAVAVRHDVALQAVLKAVDLQDRTNKPWWIVSLTDRQRDDIAMATGVDATAISAMTLDHYEGTAVGIDRVRRRLDHTFPFGCRSWSRFCPACLAESGGRWQLQWRFGWVFACVRHRCLLADHCSKCGQRQRATHRKYSVVPQPLRCGSAACAGDLTTESVVVFPACHAVIEAQALVLKVIADDRADFGVYAKCPRPAVSALVDLKSISTRILTYAADHGLAAIQPDNLLPETFDLDTPVCWSYRRNRSELKAPQVAAEAALAITAAMSILRSDDIVSAADRASWFAVKQCRHGIMSALTLGPVDGAMASAILLKAFAPPGMCSTGPVFQLRYRTTLSNPARPEAHNHRSRSIAGTVPSMLWPDWSIRLCPGEFQRSSTRFALACATLLVGTTSSTTDAARLLGGLHGGPIVRNALEKLQWHSRWEGVCTAITRLSEYLNTNPGPIDYARRRSLDYHALLPDDRWAHICLTTGTHPGTSRQKALLARAYLYQKISGLPARQILATTTSADLLPILVCRTADVPVRMTPELTQALDAEAQRYLYNHCASEPLTWSPPPALIGDLDLPHPDPGDIDIAALHHLAADRSLTTGQIAHRLNVSSHAVRHMLAAYPAVSEAERIHARMCAELRPEALHDLLVGQALTLTAIASQLEVPLDTVRRHAQRHGIREPRHRQAAPDPDWLYRQYVLDRRTLADIAAETGVVEGTVSKWMRNHRVLARNNGIRPPHRPMGKRTARKMLDPWLTAGRPAHMLQHFADALEYPTMREAAQGLGIGPGTLRTHIEALENTFGAVLLLRARTPLPMRATPAGERLAAAIHIVFDSSR